MMLYETMLCVLGGYLLGSVSFAILVSQWFGLEDPRAYGSHNAGATNVLRSGSRMAALLTLLGDALKGVAAVLAAPALAGFFGFKADIGLLAGAAGLGAFIGHLYPLYFKFKGGKGVATFLGIVVALEPWLGLIVGAVWLGVAIVFRYSSLASLLAAVVAPVVYALIWGGGVTAALLGIMAALLFYKHRDNIARLCKGVERKLGAPRV